MSKNYIVKKETIISSTPEHIFSIWCDLNNWSKWTKSIDDISFTGEKAVRAGIKIMIRQPQLRPALWTITEVKPNQSLTWQKKSFGLTITARHFVTNTADGAKVNIQIIYEGFLAGMAYKKTAALTDQYLSMEITGLKTFCESNTGQKKAAENPYEGLRERALAISSDQLGFDLTARPDYVYGVIMDWEMRGAVATVVAFITGDASLYLSSGGGIIGGGQHQKVSDAAQQFVRSAQNYIAKAEKTNNTPLPATNHVKFYFLTGEGILAGQEDMQNFENNSSPWLPFFEEANNVLTELRIISQKNKP